MSQEALLQPSLSDDTVARSVFSERATFVVSFFGGPITTLIISGWNAKIMGRLKKDTPLIITCLLGFLVAAYFLLEPPTGVTIKEWIDKLKADDPLYRHYSRALGLGFWAIFYVRHKALVKAAQLSDSIRKPWIPALICLALGVPLSIGLMILITYFHA